MNFYVRYMNMYDMEIIEYNAGGDKAVVSNFFNDDFSNSLEGKIYSVNPWLGVNGTYEAVSTFVSITTPSTMYKQGRIIDITTPPKQADEMMLFKTDYENTFGTSFNMTDAATHASGLTYMYNQSMKTYGTYYEGIFGEDYLTKDYTLALYWGYPYEGGVQTADIMVMHDLYIGNDPAYDQIINRT